MPEGTNLHRHPPVVAHVRLPDVAAHRGPAAFHIPRAALRAAQRVVASDTFWLVLWAFGFRIVSAGLGFLVNATFPLNQREQFTVFRNTDLFWDSFARYDSGWYLGIARDGYRYVEDGRSNLAFFPLYPTLMRLFGRPFGHLPHDFFLAGILVSWVAFAVAMVMLYRVAMLDLPRPAAERAVCYAGLFPFAFFYGVVYSESLFLMLLVIAVYGLRTRRWIVGGLAGALLTATRVNGVMAIPTLMWIGWRSAGSDRRQRAYGLTAGALSAAGVTAYSIYVHTLSGSFLEWYASITRWEYYPGSEAGLMFATLIHRLLADPYNYLANDPAGPHDALNGSIALLFLVAIPFVWRRLGGPYGLLMLANLALPISSGKYEGLGRYCAVLFPMFIWLATFRGPRVHTVIVAVFAMLYMLCFTLFINLYPLF